MTDKISVISRPDFPPCCLNSVLSFYTQLYLAVHVNVNLEKIIKRSWKVLYLIRIWIEIIFSFIKICNYLVKCAIPPHAEKVSFISYFCKRSTTSLPSYYGHFIRLAQLRAFPHIKCVEIELQPFLYTFVSSSSKTFPVYYIICVVFLFNTSSDQLLYFNRPYFCMQHSPLSSEDFIQHTVIYCCVTILNSSQLTFFLTLV